jgi:hypothetical protein
VNLSVVPVLAIVAIVGVAALLLWTRRLASQTGGVNGPLDALEREPATQIPLRAGVADMNAGPDLGVDEPATQALSGEEDSTIPEPAALAGNGRTAPARVVGADETRNESTIAADPGFALELSSGTIAVDTAPVAEGAPAASSPAPVDAAAPCRELETPAVSDVDPAQAAGEHDEEQPQVTEGGSGEPATTGCGSATEALSGIERQAGLEESATEIGPDVVTDCAVITPDAHHTGLGDAGDSQRSSEKSDAAPPAEPDRVIPTEEEDIPGEPALATPPVGAGALEQSAPVAGQPSDDLQEDSTRGTPEVATLVVRDDPASISSAPPSAAGSRARRRPPVHRDRRGSRRVTGSSVRPALGDSAKGATGTADVSIRLLLHPIQKTAAFSVVLARPDGFPGCITLTTGGDALGAYDERRYDDIDVPAGASLLGGELRFESLEGFKWVRSARRVQILSTAPSELGLISVPAARTGREHAIVCRPADVPEVRRIADLTGSPPLVSHGGWCGVPPDCAVFSGYWPERAVNENLEISLRPLDPGASIEIDLSGGLPVRLRAYAEGHPPAIAIEGLPAGTTVSIGGEAARRTENGHWVAAGWDAPGRHTIDVVPGPSLTYEIMPDPARGAGWTFWNVYENRFGAGGDLPWARAEICGAQVAGPSGSAALAAETQAVMIVLSINGSAAMLRGRPEASVSVGVLYGDPAFLICASGTRRSQGRVIWLGSRDSVGARTSRAPDRAWIEAVRMAAARRLPLVGADETGRRAWRMAVARARRLARAGR